MGKTGYFVVLAVALALLWVTLSGRVQDVLILSLGGLSLAIALFVTARMRLFDRETVPYARLHGLLPYWGWLFREIVKANLAVARIVLSPRLDFTPRLVRVPSTSTTDLGRTVFANSITLTPGTVTIQADDDHMLVHALDGRFVDLEEFAEMSARSARAVDGAPDTLEPADPKGAA